MNPSSYHDEIFQRAYQDAVGFFYHSSSPLHRACHYAMMGQGKRIRPLLSLWCCELTGKPASHALASALALEWIHTYSLVHDDLPAMDNDDLRRGRPTVHRAFSEAEAILVGDALLTDAFAILAGSLKNLLPTRNLPEAIRVLSKACGSSGMVLGQSLDLYWTGRGGATKDQLLNIHAHKTGALIRASCELGCLAAGADEAQRALARSFGEKIGLIFQIRDDLIDGSSDTGKTPGKDSNQGKLTFLSFISREEALVFMRDLGEKALQEIRAFEGDLQASERLKGLVEGLMVLI